MTYLITPLDSSHKRSDFSCGKDLLDNYFWFQANQDVKRKLAACFVLSDQENNIIGYYTLSSNSIANDLIPSDFGKKLPKSYTSIPTILLGRLAIDKKFHRQGYGKILLIDALKRCNESSDSLGAFAVVVDPIDNEAEEYYQKYGFIKLPDSGKLFLPMKTINKLFL
jgi:predicted GNAT family N-acyltransferase